MVFSCSDSCSHILLNITVIGEFWFIFLFNKFTTAQNTQSARQTTVL